MRLSIAKARYGMMFAIGALVGAAGMVAPADAASYPPRTLMLLVASWCAPCRTELARLDSIVDAAGPVAVRVVPIDDRPATRAMLRDVPRERVWRTAVALDLVSRETGGLPFSLMTDDAGRRCATHARPLDADAVAAMRRRCGLD